MIPITPDLKLEIDGKIARITSTRINIDNITSKLDVEMEGEDAAKNRQEKKYVKKVQKVPYKMANTFQIHL